MERLGGACAALALIGRRLVADGHLRIYKQSSFAGFAGAATRHGSTYKPEINEWMAVGDWWFDAWYDPSHATTVVKDVHAPRTLQFVLAHELDHLAGETHLDGSLTHTLNTQACSGLPW